MVVNIDSTNLTAVVLDDADNPTKQVVFGNWNPVELRKWKNEQELRSFIGSMSANYWTDYVAPEAPAE
jgi:hypothetical protein